MNSACTSLPSTSLLRKANARTSCSKALKIHFNGEWQCCSAWSCFSPNWSSHHIWWESVITVVNHQSSHPQTAGKLRIGHPDLLYHSHLFVKVRWMQILWESCCSYCVTHAGENTRVQFSKVILVGKDLWRSVDLIFIQSRVSWIQTTLSQCSIWIPAVCSGSLNK